MITLMGLLYCFSQDAAVRCELSAADLYAGVDRQVQMAEFRPMHDATAPPMQISGTITLDSSFVRKYPQTLVRTALPAVRFHVLSDGKRLYVRERGRIIRDTSGRSTWDMIVGHGSVTLEPLDGGRLRVVLPVTLTGRVYNDARQGTLTFLIDNGQASPGFIQFSQETASWIIESYAGEVAIGWEAGNGMTEAERVRWQEIESEEYPVARLDPQHVASLRGPIARAEHSALAVLDSGGLFHDGCPTRNGDMLQCMETRHGMYSVSKTMAGAITLAWLAKRYGAQVYDARVVDLLNVTASHNGWNQVTLLDLLHMATGIGEAGPARIDGNMYADENSLRQRQYFEATSRAAKLNVAFSFGNYPWGPGEEVRYNTSHTFVLSAAIDAFVRQTEGVDVDYWDLVNADVYSRIGLGYIDIQRTLEFEGRGVPYLGTGLFLTMQEALRLADLLLHEGVWDGVELIDSALIRGGLHRDEMGQLYRGVQRPGGASYYHASLFTEPVGCAHPVVYAAGFGGNVIALAEDTAALSFTDTGYYNHVEASSWLAVHSGLCEATVFTDPR